MPDNITPLQFWLGVITVLAPQLYNIYKANKDAKTQQTLTAAQSESAMGDALEKLGQAYARALSTVESQDKELAGLRPLILEMGLLKQQCSQTELDKADWKAHSAKLTEQLEEAHLIPAVFKRQSLEGDSEKMKAITQAQVDKYLNRKEGNNH